LKAPTPPVDQHFAPLLVLIEEQVAVELGQKYFEIRRCCDYRQVDLVRVHRGHSASEGLGHGGCCLRETLGSIRFDGRRRVRRPPCLDDVAGTS
jgi:hypothetical protein